MTEESIPLTIVRFRPADFDLAALATRLTEFKGVASRTPTPVTVEQLQAIGTSETNVLLLQMAGEIVVGMIHVAVIYLEDRAHIGPICVDTTNTPRGHGTPLMQAAIDYVTANFADLRRIDLTNRPSHDIGEWYKKFGFEPRTEAAGDPSTVYRLSLK